MKRKVTLLVADHEPVVRFGVTQFLRQRGDWSVCGDADSAPTARSLCERHKPDVLVLDPGLSAGEGFSLIREAAAWNANVRVVAFTALEDAGSMVRAFRAGVSAYVTRQEPLHELALAIDSALSGRMHMGPRVQHMLTSQMRTGQMEISSRLPSVLSPREQQIFLLVGEGCGKKEMASRLNLSSKTIDTHQQRIKDKLDIASCAELRKRAAIYVHSARSGTREDELQSSDEGRKVFGSPRAAA